MQSILLFHSVDSKVCLYPKAKRPILIERYGVTPNEYITAK